MRLVVKYFLICFLTLMTSSMLYANYIEDIINRDFKNKNVLFEGVSIEVPDIAENGSVVSVNVLFPKLQNGVSVIRVRIYKAYKPEKPIASFVFSKKSRARSVATRIKLSKTTQVSAFIELTNGNVLATSREIKVTIGGCGGGGGYGSSYSGSYTPPAASTSPTPLAPSEPSVTAKSYSRQSFTQAGTLTAGEIDDNLNYSSYLQYTKRFGAQSVYPSLKNRITLVVVDQNGIRLQQAHLQIRSSHNQNVTTGFTGALGQFQFFPNMNNMAINSEYEVSIAAHHSPSQGKKYRARFSEQDLDTARRIIIRTEEKQKPQISKIDVMFVFDTTGSMADELSYLNNEFNSIVSSIKNKHRNVDIRFGLTLYRDNGDEYLVRNLGFTNNANTMQDWLSKQYASGGGDYPEAMDEALGSALQSQWRDDSGTVKLLFLVADAPPHTENTTKAILHAQTARAKGIRIFPIAASGVADKAEHFMRFSALITHGRHLFLTDDSGVGNSHQEPKIACYLVTRLDQLIVRTVNSEITGKRIEANKNQILRMVGVYENGMCR